jgi:hypothetical protein
MLWATCPMDHVERNFVNHCYTVPNGPILIGVFER